MDQGEAMMAGLPNKALRASVGNNAIDITPLRQNRALLDGLSLDIARTD
jgi:hypothetical protein